MRQLKISVSPTQRIERSISSYFLEVNKIPLITAEEEVELAYRIQSGDKKALEKLVLANLRFVISVAKQYQFQGLSFPDLINEGNIGLITAANRFDASRGFKFISYAVWWIRQSIIGAIGNTTRIVRLPVNRLTTINKSNKAISKLEQKLEREPTNDEIAGFLGLRIDQIELAEREKQRQTSFDKPLKTDFDSDMTLLDVIMPDSLSSPDKELLDDSLTQNVQRLLTKLSDHESEILNLSYGLKGASIKTQSEIAHKYNISTERVRQIRILALKKLKTLIEDNNYLMDT